MNNKLKAITKYAAVFIIGLVTGAFLLESLERNVRPTYLKIIRNELAWEQEMKASRAASENKPLLETFHRWAAVQAGSENGFRVFKPESRVDDGSFLFPFYMYGLKRISSPGETAKGRNALEGINRGKLAVAFEKIGQAEAAEKQWKLAQSLTRWPTTTVTKSTIHSLLKRENTELQQNLENSILGPPEKIDADQ